MNAGRQAPTARPRQIAVIGAGWAGLAAAVRLVQQGEQVTLMDMAHQPGGRARQLNTPAGAFDNGQHILIGAYHATLDLMRDVGADTNRLLLRRPLCLRYPDGSGLALSPGHPALALLRAVLAAQGWRWGERLALLRAAARWRWQRFECAPSWTVAQLGQALPARVRNDLIDPLCVATLNTPAELASASVFLRVLHDALLSGPGSADLLLPRAGLSALLPDPAWRWLQAAGATCRTGCRAQVLARAGSGWTVDDQPYDAVVLACSATEAARLTAPHQPGWAAQAAALRYQPIVTAYLADPKLRLPQPMLALRSTGPQAPAQFVFDLGALGHSPGHFAWVASGAELALAPGLAACGAQILAQARATFQGAFTAPDAQVLLHLTAERRATFACTPGLVRPPAEIAPGLVAAGDYVAGPYPATLEGAVRAGNAGALALRRLD